MTSYKDQHKQAEKEVREAIDSLKELSFNIDEVGTVEFVPDESHWKTLSCQEAVAKDEAILKGKDVSRVSVVVQPYAGVTRINLTTDILGKIEATSWKTRKTLVKIAEARSKAHALRTLAMQERQTKLHEAVEQGR